MEKRAGKLGPGRARREQKVGDDDALRGVAIRGNLRTMIAHAEVYRFSVEEYERLGEAGIFQPDERVELLDGEIIAMAPIGKLHAKAVRQLNRMMNLRFNDVCVVDSQNPIILDDHSEPQPDVLLIRPELHQTSELPRPADVLLLVEVADSSYLYDAGAKLRAYARSGIPEYWVVNLVEACVEVFRQPAGDGYAERIRLVKGDNVAPGAFPDREIALADILP